MYTYDRVSLFGMCHFILIFTILWGTRDQIANIQWIVEKAREFQKNIYFCFIDYAKAFDCVVWITKLENS